MRKILRITTLFIILLLCLSSANCSKEEVRNNIPYVKVDFYFSPLSADKELAGYGGIKFFRRRGYGNNGVYVCQFSATGDNGYVAFDATCPNEEKTGFNVAVKVESERILKLKCPVCNTEYDLLQKGLGGKTRLTQYPVKERAFGHLFQVINY